MLSTARRLLARPETILAIFVAVLAAAIRLPDVGFKPFMHDESLFAYYSFHFWQYGAMDYDPLLHGPLLLEANAIFFQLFGASDATARLFCALCGIGVCLVIVIGRPLRDEWANLAAGFFAAVSPTLAYYSRFCRNDMPFALFTILWVAACAAYWRRRRARWGVVAALAFVAMACIKENVVFLVATALAFAALLVVADLIADRKSTVPPLPSVGRFLFVNNVALVVLLVLYLGAIAWGNLRSLSPMSVYVAIVVLAPMVSFTFCWFEELIRSGRGADSLARRIALRLWRDRFVLGVAAAVGLMVFLLVFNFGVVGRFSLARVFHGGHWLGDPPLDGESGTLGFFDILERAVGYWWGQHDEHRLRGPFHYYVPILLVYEWPPLLVALAGVGWALARTHTDSLGRTRTRATAFTPALARLDAVGVCFIMSVVVSVVFSAAFGLKALDRWLHVQSTAHLAGALFIGATATVLTLFELLARRRMRAFVVFWCATSLLAFSYAGEKTPWLTVHIALPLALLAGLTVGDFARWTQNAVALKESSATGRVALAVRRADVLAILAVCVALAVAAETKQSRDLGRLLANGHDPDERLVFNHTTLETKFAVDEIMMSRRRHEALGLPFTVAMTGEASWPMLWYLRDLEGEGLDAEPGLTTPTATVVLCDPKDLDEHPAVEERYVTKTLPLRAAWVAPRAAIARPLVRAERLDGWFVQEPIDWTDWSEEWRWLWRYWLAREVFPPPESGEPPPFGVAEFVIGWERQGRE